MELFMPVAGLSISLLVLLVVGGIIGSLSGLFGVGGGFLVTPILMFLGIPPTVAAASGSCQMVATSSSGMAAHSRLGNVDYKMGAVLLIGGLVGADLGVHAIQLLRILGEADLVITLTYVIVLGSLGSYMFLESFQTLRRGALAGKKKMAPMSEGRLSRLPWQMDFPRSGVRHSILVPLFLSAIVGVLASIMGVGGGFIMIPMMVYLLGMPTHEAVGTSLFQILFLCAGITYMQAATNQTVDLILVLPLALGSAVGAQAGARMGRLLRGEQLMILLATLVLLVTGKMVTDLVLMPPSRLKPAEIYRREQITEDISEMMRMPEMFLAAPLQCAQITARGARPPRLPLPRDREKNNFPPETAPRTTAWLPDYSYTYRAGCSKPSGGPRYRAHFPFPRHALS